MAAYRQAKRIQRGVKLGFEQNISLSSTTKFVSTPIPIGTSDFSLEFYGNTYGSFTNKNVAIYNANQLSVYGKYFLFIYQTESKAGGIEWIVFEKPAIGADLDDSIRLGYKPNNPLEKFHFVITRQGTTVKVYINGELKATKEQSEVKDLGDLQLAIANSSDVGFVRVWNMCLSADDVTDHYNNGDPMGYVVPKVMRMPHIEFPTSGHTESNGVFKPNSISDTTLTTDIPQANGFSGNYMRFDAVTTVSLYCSYFLIYLKGTPPIKITMEYRSNHDIYEGIIAGNPGMMLASANEGDAKVIEVHYPSSIGQTYLGIAGNDPNAWLEIRVLSIEPVGLLAEYLPQNLMCGRDDKSIATSWLDSAKQLPLSDEYLPPLFQSIGGYDMAAKGAPEILYNE